MIPLHQEIFYMGKIKIIILQIMNWFILTLSLINFFQNQTQSVHKERKSLYNNILNKSSICNGADLDKKIKSKEQEKIEKEIYEEWNKAKEKIEILEKSNKKLVERINELLCLKLYK